MDFKELKRKMIEEISLCESEVELIYTMEGFKVGIFISGMNPKKLKEVQTFNTKE